MFQINKAAEDVVRVCCDCNKQFWIEAGEQAFFDSKSMPYPKRCKPCRQIRRETINKKMEEKT